MPMEEQHDSSSSSPFNNNSGGHYFPSTPPSPNVSFKFTDDNNNNNKVVSPNRKNSSSPNKNTIIELLLPRTAPPRPSTPPLPNNNNNTDDIHPDRVINIPITDSPSMATNVSELSHNSSLRTPTNNTIGSSTNYNSKKPLNSKQQAAMNNFLTAKSKEDKAKAWEDLVHSLKQTNHHHRNNKNGGSVDSYNSRGSQQKQRKGIGSSGSVGSSGSNHSLGFIQFHPKPSSSSSSSVRLKYVNELEFVDFNTKNKCGGDVKDWEIHDVYLEQCQEGDDHQSRYYFSSFNSGESSAKSGTEECNDSDDNNTGRFTSTMSILANVWYQDVLIRIDPVTAKVTRVYDLSDIYPYDQRKKDGADCLNGISVTGKESSGEEEDGLELWVTGKLWPKMYRIRLID
mmetsp:Transcript_11355/g.19445  ORF Transcript_11355/g.19445 Transcript_11355/m.19445 type:complete len:398 (-) Transcript_11355:44-1237(-)